MPGATNHHLDVQVSGDLWWNGFTADITLTNTSSSTVDNWSWSFNSPHSISGSAWGADINSVTLDDGSYTHTLTGTDWGASIKAGSSITIGFNGSQGVAIGNNGSLTAELLFSSSESISPNPPPTPEPQPEPAPTPAPDEFPEDSLAIAVSGDLWWNGFTADITLTNTSSSTVDDWSWSFNSPHSISGSAWGADISSITLDDGSYTHTLTGTDWGASIKAGSSITIGFNGSQGVAIGNNGSLTAELLFSSSESISPNPPPTPEPQPEPAPTPAPPHSNNAPDYSKALELSFLFYEANRSGDLDEATNRISWRGDSGLDDGCNGIYFGSATETNLQNGLSLDLSGGYHDAGDHVKFGFPLASTLSTLAWGGISFPEGYTAAGEMNSLLDAVRWGTDYLLKAHGVDHQGTTNFFIAQVGDGHADHALWSAPEEQNIPRPAMAVTPDKPGSDVAAASAAALAAASVLFRQEGDANYADTLLEHSEALFTFADRYRGKYSDAIPEVQSFYNSWSGYNDELAYGAAWLARALDASGVDGSNYQTRAHEIYHQSIGGLNNGWTHNWDDASYATAVLLAEDMDDTAALNDIRNWLDSWVEGNNGVAITDGGLRYISSWGSLRYSANTAMLASVVADSLIDPEGRYSDLARDSIDYILGDNPRQASYLVGYGSNHPQQPHHRAASGVGWSDFDGDQPNEHVLHGALVGGPTAADDFAYNDARSDYISNEVAIDYNAGFTGALAFLSGHSAEME